MTIVVAFCAMSQPSSSSASTQESAQYATTIFSTPAYTCWGERIRTSDWLIQNSRDRNLGQKSVLSGSGRAGL